MWALATLFIGSIIIIWIALVKEGQKEEPYDLPEPYNTWNNPWAEPEIEERHFSKPREMSFDEYIGQIRHVKRVQLAIKYALDNEKPMGHCAFVGSAGTGKTALASCVTNALGRKAVYTTGQAINSIDVLADAVEQADGGILFIDEAHDLKLADGIVTGMLPLLEDWKLSTSTGTIEVKPFTCIMATTNWGDLDKAIRSRMGQPYELDPYNDSEMKRIVQSHAKKMEIEVKDKAAEFIALRSRKNPRCSSLMLLEARNVTPGIIGVSDCMTAFELLKIDRMGLREHDRRLLKLLTKGKCAKSRCAGFLGMDVKTFEATVSTYLFNEGLISVGSRGTEITEKGSLYIGDQ